jgi:hypothetical protein
VASTRSGGQASRRCQRSAGSASRTATGATARTRSRAAADASRPAAAGEQGGEAPGGQHAAQGGQRGGVEVQAVAGGVPVRLVALEHGDNDAPGPQRPGEHQPAEARAGHPHVHVHSLRHRSPTTGTGDRCLPGGHRCG